VLLYLVAAARSRSQPLASFFVEQLKCTGELGLFSDKNDTETKILASLY
jgi:hypothetical protein